MSKSELESLLLSYNSRMGWATIAVAVGILGEYVNHFVFSKEAKGRFEFALTIIFAVCVLGGVVGEWRYGEKLSETASSLQRIADSEVAKAQQKSDEAKAQSDSVQVRLSNANARAEDARKEAAKAIERAAKAEANLAGALASAESAKATAKGFESQIADSNRKSAEANARAAQATLELAKMRTPRSIRSQEQIQMAKALESFAGTPYDLAVSADSESIDLMRTVRSILVAAKWIQIAHDSHIQISGSDPMIGISAQTGITVEIAQSKLGQWRGVVDTLVELLNAEGIIAHGFAAATGVKPNAVHINIGKKL